MSEPHPPIQILYLGGNPTDASKVQSLLEAAQESLPSLLKVVQDKEDYLAALKTIGVDLILAEHCLPQYDCAQALKAAKEISPGTSFILMTDAAHEEDAIQQLTDGVVDYVRKDQFQRLLPVIRRALKDADQKRRRQKNHKALQSGMDQISRQDAELTQLRRELDSLTGGLSRGLEITDMDRNVVGLNVEGAALLGFAGEAEYREALPHLLETFEIFYPDGRPMPVEELPFERIFRGETLTNYIVHFHRRDTGTRLVLSYNGSLLRNEGGTPVLTVLTFRDVTEQHTPSKTPSESEVRARTMGESVPYGVWWCNVKGGTEYASPAFLNLLEMTMGEVTELGWTSRMHPEAVAPMMKKWVHCLETGEDWEHEHEILGPDGKYHSVLSRGKAVRDTTGTIVGWAGINLDFDKHKALEDALRESEERFRTMADRSPIMTWVTSTRGEIEMVNHAWDDFFGVTEAQVKKTDVWETVLHPDDIGEYVKSFATSLHEQIAFQAQARVRNKNGEWRWVHSSGAPRFSPEGQFLGIVGTSSDITDQVRAVELLRQTSENLRLMVTYSTEAMLIVDGRGLVEAVSASGARLLGFEEEELLGRRVEDLMEPLSRIERARRLEELQKLGTTAAVSALRIKTKSGAFQWMSVAVTMIRHREGPEVKALIKLERMDLPSA